MKRGAKASSSGPCARLDGVWCEETEEAAAGAGLGSGGCWDVAEEQGGRCMDQGRGLLFLCFLVET